MSKFYFVVHANGNIADVTTEGNRLYQGMTGIAQYHFKMAEEHNPGNVLPGDTVLINFNRPDGQRATDHMRYNENTNEWVCTSNGWETDIDIPGDHAVLNVSFEARRYSTIQTQNYVRVFTSGLTPINIYPSTSYVPLGIPSPIVDGILERLTGLEGDVADLTEETSGLQSSKVDKQVVETAGESYAYTSKKSYEGVLSQELTRISERIIPDTLVQRDNSGNISVPAIPQEAQHAVGAEYVSNQFIENVYSKLGAPNGIATLDSGGKIPSGQLPSYVDDVIEVATFSALPATGENGKIYITLDTNLTYRWSGSQYVEISKSLALGETSTTAYRGDLGAELHNFVSPAFESGETLQTKLNIKADKTDLIKPWTVGTVTANEFTVNCNDNLHYKLNSAADVKLYIDNAVNGYSFVIKLYGGGQLDLSEIDYDDVAGWDYIDAESTQYYLYQFDYDGERWVISKLAVNDRSSL